MRYGLITIVIFVLTGLNLPLFAQQHIFKNYTVNDGLVANAIRRIYQDSKGFLWIATWEGLSKYDGHQFTNYSTANGLSQNMVNDFYESKDGKFYLAINNGNIDIVNENNIIQNEVRQTPIVNRFLHFSRQRVIVTTDAKGIFEFRDGKLIKTPPISPDTTYSDLVLLNDSLFIVAAEKSIQVINEKYELVTEIRNAQPVYIDAKIYQDSKKRIWAGTYGGLKLIAGFPQRNQPITFSSLPASFNIPALQLNKVNDIFEDANGIFWIGTTGGLVKINPDGSNQLITTRDGLPSDNVTYIFQDRERNIWFGTNLGLSKLVSRSDIRVYTTENGLWANNMYFLHRVKKGHLLISTPKGMQLFNTTTGKFTTVAHGLDHSYYGIVPNTNPPLLVGYYGMATFDTLNSYSRKVRPFTNIIYYNTCDDQGGYFFANYNHLFFSSEKKDHVDTLLDHIVTTLLIDKKNYIWAGTLTNGLYRIKYSFENCRLRIHEKDHYLPDKYIRSLFEDSKGNIWAGTRYHGVYRLSEIGKNELAISNLDQTKGLTSNWVKGIAEDGSGNIWIAFYQGLDKLIQQDSLYRIFNFSRVNNLFVSIASMLTDEDRTLWLATSEGMVHIHDGEMEKLPPLPVYITKVFSQDSVYAPTGGKLNISYKHNQLQFEFTSPGFINEKQILYSYRLLGSNTDAWSHPSNQHTVSYASLQSGTYRFEVRSSGWNGSLGEPAVFEFTITPPFWQTWWFMGICSLLIVAGCWWLFKRRINYIRHESGLKQKIAETEMMALRAQMNPHFIFNCLNSIDNLIQNNEKEKASRYLSRFARLIRAILENSKQEVVPVWKDMETLKLYLELESLRCDNKFSYAFNISDELQNGDYKVPPLIIQPFVENAIVHGLMSKEEDNRHLLISGEVQNGNIKFVVEDNGIGRALAEDLKKINKPAHASLGLNITKERINLHNQKGKGESVLIKDLVNQNKRATGTRVEIILENK